MKRCPAEVSPTWKEKHFLIKDDKLDSLEAILTKSQELYGIKQSSKMPFVLLTLAIHTL